MSDFSETLHEPDDDRLRRYVAGQLPEAEAEAFEEHYFVCEVCWREVQAAAEIRAALGPRPRQLSRSWPALAAAAAAALLMIGVWQMVQQQSAREPVWRGGQQMLATTVARTNGIVAITWAPQPEARRYAVDLFRPDGSSLSRDEVTANQFSPVPQQATHYRVRAIDELGGVIADSGIKPLK